MGAQRVESVASREVGLPAAVAFDRLTALRNHERLIPLTRVDAPARRPRPGDIVVATSARVLRDTMELTEYTRPGRDGVGRAWWVKRGPVLLGEAGIVVTALGEHRCRIDWVEREIHLAMLPPALTTRPLTWLIGLMTRLALGRFARLSAPRHESVRQPVAATRRGNRVVP